LSCEIGVADRVVRVGVAIREVWGKRFAVPWEQAEVEGRLARLRVVRTGGGRVVLMGEGREVIACLVL
jgi:hypothetical protein